MDIIKKPRRKIYKIVSGILGYCIIGAVILYAAISIFAPKKVISTFGFQYFVIQTDSMVPVINVGDIVVLEKADLDHIERNQIMSFYADINDDGKKEVLTHYFDLTEEENGITYYRTKSEKGADRYDVTADDIIGFYHYRIPFLGKIILFLRAPLGMFVLTADIIIIILIIRFSKKDDE